jgi:hypothetical protein
MTRHLEFEDLQDYQEDLLPPERAGEISRHLEECPLCRRELQALRDLLDEMAGLPEEAEPTRDLWPQIQWRLREGKAGRMPRRGWAAVTLPVWQLAAASIAVALISGGAVWTFLSRAPEGPLAGSGPTVSTVQPAGLVAGYEDFDSAIAELEAVLEEGWEVLDPETVAVLQENLAVIDRAIAESREALAQDPGSRLLRRILTETMRRKVDFLQQATLAVYANT